MNPLRWLIAAPAWQTLSTRYDGYRLAGSSALAAGIHCFWLVLGWSLLRFEAPGWQRIIAQRRTLWPHISPERPRPLDILRFLSQSIWLLLFLPQDGSTRSQRKRFNAFHRLFGWRQQAYLWLDRLPQHIHRGERLEEKLNRLSPGLRKLLFICGSLIAAALALLCISQPFDLFTQFIFVLMLWALAMVVRRVPGRLATMMLIVLSLTVSCRYLWWRYTSTLNWDDPVSLTFGLLLIVAETYAWVVLVLGYFQTLWPLHRQPVSLPEDTRLWPSVDLLVPTYNEPMSVVKTNDLRRAGHRLAER
ncbi:Cellulose synthase catalytic subunit (UDP-forming) [Mixta intestinalis]|uniref:Cellulose synthase catalytic subunit (UDP-forming) n=1 Tax=Mixta intestinalis TaxID=1615494 RepID=A0A6P1Q3W3_9GAMM|nr:Cellulose synthase catalytic subunit (UDP-forming) [Mixta intestinalis]